MLEGNAVRLLQSIAGLVEAMSKPWLAAKTAGEALLLAMPEHTYKAIAAALIEWHEAQRVCERGAKCPYGPELAAAYKELAEWRSGRRRVYYRIQISERLTQTFYAKGGREQAAIGAKRRGVKRVRITVRPKGAKR